MISLRCWLKQPCRIKSLSTRGFGCGLLVRLLAALLRGELDARSNNPTSVLKRNPEWLEKGVMNFHSILEAPKGLKHPRFGHLPEIESFAKSEKEIKLLKLWRSFRVIGSPYVLPPGTPRRE